MAQYLSLGLNLLSNMNESGQFYTGHLLTRIFELESLLQQKESQLNEERLLARTDALTGMPNRRALIEHLQNALQDEIKFLPTYATLKTGEKREKKDDYKTEEVRVGVAIGFIDLDSFKAINDTHGHEAGDAVLREVASFLATKFRESDTFALYKIPIETKEIVGRLGGDEFLLVLRHTNSAHLRSRSVEIEAELNMLKIDFVKPDGKTVEIKIKGSLGITDCNLTISARENLDAADKLMYERKLERKEAVYKGHNLALDQLQKHYFSGSTPAPSP